MHHFLAEYREPIVKARHKIACIREVVTKPVPDYSGVLYQRNGHRILLVRICQPKCHFTSPNNQIWPKWNRTYPEVTWVNRSVTSIIVIRSARDTNLQRRSQCNVCIQRPQLKWSTSVFLRA